MKLTKDMFDFEKYDYHLYWAGGLKPGVEVFNINAQRWAEQVYPGDSYNLVRILKAPPRYILLNEGEQLQEGDEFFAYDGIHPRMWHEMPGRTNDVQKREVWRRKVQE